DLGVLVEVRERGTVEDLVGQHARLYRVEEVKADGPFLEAAHQRLEPVDVHGLGEAVAHGLAHQHVVGDLDGTGRGAVLAGGGRREDGGHQVVRLHALDV